MGLQERFWAKVDISGDCWIWTASLDHHGYGRFYPSAGCSIGAHRWAYERARGVRLHRRTHLHHSCGTTACVNPAHLEPLTAREHRRAHSVQRTHCKHGHSLEEHGVYVEAGGRWRRICRECRRMNQRIWRERHPGLSAERVREYRARH